MSWGDFFTFVPMIEEINHIIEFHPLILKLVLPQGLGSFIIADKSPVANLIIG